MKKTFLGLIIILNIGIFLLKNEVFAQNKEMSLTVFPAIQEITIKPGEKTRGQVQFRNASNQPVFGQIKVADFVVKDQTGTPILIDPSQNTSKYSAARWFSLNQEYITIPPKDFITIDFNINPPTKISTCSRHSIIYLEQTPENLIGATKQKPAPVSQITTQFGALINLLVENQTCKENMNIINLTAPSFSEYGPIDVSFSILNLSDFYIVPKGTITILNLFNQVVDQKNIAEQRIFPEVARIYKDKVGEKIMLGRYKLVVKAASNGKNSVTKESFIYLWVFPWKVAVVIILTLTIIILIVRHFYVASLLKEKTLEEELEKEKEEIEELKKELKKRDR